MSAELGALSKAKLDAGDSVIIRSEEFDAEKHVDISAKVFSTTTYEGSSGKTYMAVIMKVS